MIRSLILMILCVSMPALAMAKITVINQSPKTSVMAGLAFKTQSALEQTADFYQSRDCQDAANKFRSDTTSLLIYATDNVAAAAAKNLDCAIPLIAEQIVVSAWQSFSFCRLPDSGVALHQSSTLGMSGMHPYRKWIAEFNQRNNASISARVFQGSSATLKALLAREISWGFIATAVAKPAQTAGTIVCDYTTDHREPRFLANHYRHSLSDLRLQVLILYRGTDTQSVRDQLRRDDFVRYLETSGYTDILFTVDDIRRKQLDLDYQNLKSFY